MARLKPDHCGKACWGAWRHPVEWVTHALVIVALDAASGAMTIEPARRGERVDDAACRSVSSSVLGEGKAAVAVRHGRGLPREARWRQSVRVPEEGRVAYAAALIASVGANNLSKVVSNGRPSSVWWATALRRLGRHARGV